MLFVPIWDMNHLKKVKFEYVTTTLIAVNVIVYVVFETDLIFPARANLLQTLSVHPRNVVPFGSFVLHMPEQFKLVSYMFVHGSFLHLLGNMIFLFVFGDNVEDALGHVRFILFYLLCGIAAALVHSYATTSPDLPLVGASGAISGVIGAYLLLHPNIRVWVLLPLPKLPFVPLRFSAALVIGVWIVFQIASALLLPGGTTAWWAHVGGFFTGMLLVTIMKRPDVRLFDMATGV
ncbi:MAG: rhomboid family intramembrane serine protease [Rhodomicrobium sp.]